jgi:hypothetical protein
MISIITCRKRLALLWFAGGFVIFILLVVQSTFGKFGDEAGEVWSWFLPTIMPTLSLIVGVLVVDLTSAQDPKKKVDRFIFRLAFSLSLVYLLLVLSTLMVQPLTRFAPTEMLKRSNLWLGPIQGLVAAALGAFFVKSERARQR